jgi:DNA-binding NarL/FixJ family response regulator
MNIFPLRHEPNEPRGDSVLASGSSAAAGNLGRIEQAPQRGTHNGNPTTFGNKPFDPQGSTRMNIRVVLVDDHKMMLDGLRALITEAPGMEVVGEAADGRTALDLVRTLSPDVVVMDIGMPDLNGIEATRRIRTEYSDTKVVALSTHVDKRYLHGMLEAGASGYVVKIAAHGELVRAITAAKAGKTYLSPEIAGYVVERSTHGIEGGEGTAYNSLGPREREVLQLVAEGKTSAETAKKMHISIKTVETHRRNITQKLKLHGTAELTKYAVREGLTSLEQ